MKISIIIPTFNEEENLLKRLSFLCEQANKYPLEIIVSNSPETTDNTPKVCKNRQKVIFLNSDKKGRAAQMNFGAQKATGDILLFLHADVQLPLDFYDQVLRAIHQENKAGFFAYKFDKKSVWLEFNSRFTAVDGLFAGGGDQCHFFQVAAFKALEGYKESYCIMEDFEMMDRVRKEKIPFAIIQSKALVSARKYEEHSWLKVNLINGLVFLSYKLGTPPKQLRKMYKHLLREGV